MKINLLQLLIGQIPEAIFFALFMIFTKRLKEKRILYIVLMTLEYILLYKVFPYNVCFQIIYTFLSYLILKLLYKEKSQITDIFTFTIASIFMIITSALMYFIAYFTFKNIAICTFIHKIVIFTALFWLRDKLYNIQRLYKKFWNKDIKRKSKIKSTTFRAINVVVFNIMFYVINIGMLFIIIQNGGV